MLSVVLKTFILATCGIQFGTTNEAKCNATIPNGSLPINCNLGIGTTCSYYCDDHFSKNPSISSIQCTENGHWNADPNLLCTKIDVTCPSKFLGGAWDNCQDRENETCTYSCFSGFHKNPKIQNATCGPDGAWNQNTEKLCRRKCDSGISNGLLNSSCSLEIGDECTFECERGFNVASETNTVVCQENSMWAPEEPCEAVLCPKTIPNGIVNLDACDRHIYAECLFNCNQGFDPNPKISKVFCDVDGKWDGFHEPYCLERKGLCVNLFDHGKWADDCQFKANEECAFECNGGFEKNTTITRNITCTSNGEWNIDLSLLCKENDRGLIVTSNRRSKNEHVSTVAIALDGTPNLDFIRSLPFSINVEFRSADGDYMLQQAYVYDRYTKAIYKDSNFSIGLSRENIWTILHKGLSHAYVKLAVDWISHNIYWTDPHYKWIMIQSLLGNGTSMHRVLIHENLEGPHALALDPMEALLFWSDIGTFTKIEVSNLLGENRKSLISSNLLYPYSMACDCSTRRIYFTDSGRKTVETVTYEGKDRKIVLKKSYSTFFDIAVFKDYLYVTDMWNVGLYFFNKTNGKELQKPLSKGGASYYGVTVFHPDAQPTRATAHCAKHGCEHICVTEKDGATCLCKDGYTLSKDMKTCSLNSQLFHRGLMFSNATSVCIVDIRVLTHFSFAPICVLKTQGTKYMILDTDDRQIILANGTAIYWASVDNPVLQLLTQPSGIISGLAWDGYDRNLYWTEENNGIIWRLSRQSNIAHVFLEALNKPRDILILPHERLVYWISGRNGSTIESSYVDGSNHQFVLDATDLVDPKSLTYDPYEKRIYFLDALPDGHISIVSCLINGSGLHSFRSYAKLLDKLEIYKGYLLVTAKDANRTLITSYSIKYMRNTTSGSFLDTGHISAIKVFDENLRQNETGPCFTLNGDCEQICISNGKSRTCACTFGFRLAGNGKTCTSDPIKDMFMLVSDYTHNDIYQISLMDQSVQGINAQETNYVTGLTYSPFNDLVIWGTDESELYIMHLNGTGKKPLSISISNDKYGYPKRFAVDYSTGNIYYTAVSNTNYFVATENHVGVVSPNGKYRTIVTGLDDPHGLVVYPSKGKLFYIDSGFNSHLGQANMDGSQSSVLLNLNNDWPTDLTVDFKSDYLYWIDHWKDSIEYCKLDGTNHNTFTQYPNTSPRGIAIYQDYMYISTRRYSHMIKTKISNPNETEEFAAHGELGTIEVISIYSSTVQRKNAFCSAGNGGCSTFCFPIPGGGMCGCEDGVELKEGSNTVCSNIPFCPEIRNQIIVSSDCSRMNGSKCTFTCKQGYKAKPGVDKVLCNGEIYTPEDPCEEIKCPTTLANGKWVNCNFSIGTFCNYTCNYGYKRNDVVIEVECQMNGNWKLANTDNLCKPITCPMEFSQGRIVSSCEGLLGRRCEFECTGYGYKKNENITRIECMESGTWSIDADSLCQQITCSNEIPNVALLKGPSGQICSRAIGTQCGFECSSGLVRTVQSIHCMFEGWAEDLRTICTVPRCPETHNRMRVSTNCQREKGSECTFTCQQGYNARPGVDKVLCNGEIYTPEDPCEAITCPRQFSQGGIVNTCAGMIGQRCDYECTGYGYRKNENIPFIQCMESGTWSRDTDSLCQQITCPNEIPNGALGKGSNEMMCSRAVGTRCDYECSSGFVKEPSVQSLYCLLDGWAQDLQTICIVSPAVSSDHHSEPHPAAIAVSVVVFVSIAIVIIYFLWKRKCLRFQFSLKKMEEEVISGPDMQMSTRFGSDEDIGYDHVEYDNCPDNITSSKKIQERDELSLPPKTTRDESSTKRYDSAIAIPRPRAKENTWNKMP